MKTLALVSFAVLALFARAQVDDEAFKKELTRLQGKWQFVSLDKGGGGIKDEKLRRVVIEFFKDNESVNFIVGGNTRKGIFEINPRKKPKEITIRAANSDRTMLGIYKIDQNVLTMCTTSKKGVARPTEFAASKDKHFVLLTLERAK